MPNKEKTTNDYELKWFDITMQEYNSLRNESAQALRSQQSIINYGLAAIGVLIAFSANLWGQAHIVESIYVVFIPFMCHLIVLIWNGEVRRMSRAGQYIKRIEDKVQHRLSDKIDHDVPALEWENFLRKPKDTASSQPNKQAKTNKLKAFLSTFNIFSENNQKLKSNYIAIIIMFGGLSILSILLGFGHNYSMYHENFHFMSNIKQIQLWIYDKSILLIIYSLLLIVDILFFIYHYRYFQNVKK